MSEVKQRIDVNVRGDQADETVKVDRLLLGPHEPKVSLGHTDGWIPGEPADNGNASGVFDGGPTHRRMGLARDAIENHAGDPDAWDGTREAEDNGAGGLCHGSRIEHENDRRP